jgi:26S proteasome regulatory subunit N1
MKLVDVIIPEFINHNEEPEAVDLLMEVEQLPQLNKFTNESNFERVCNYLQSCAQYAADPEEMKNAYKTAYEIYISQKQYALAMRVA